MTILAEAPRAYTAEEGRQLFFEQIASIYRYWMTVDLNPGWDAKGQTEVEYRSEGMLFSLFVLFDGGSGSMPAFNIIPAPHPDDAEYRREQGENWWPDDVIINDKQMHEIFNWSLLRK